jgi:hypothetical protein
MILKFELQFASSLRENEEKKNEKTVKVNQWTEKKKLSTTVGS